MIFVRSFKTPLTLPAMYRFKKAIFHELSILKHNSEDRNFYSYWNLGFATYNSKKPKANAKYSLNYEF